MSDKIYKTEEEWQSILTPMQYQITRRKGTEPPFTGEYNESKEQGVFRCVCCGNPLFTSKTKFDSGTGWPSFWAPYSEESVRIEDDNSHGMRRVEVLCQRCDAHLGHVFDDGPPPTNQRFCINSIALKLNPAETEGQSDAG